MGSHHHHTHIQAELLAATRTVHSPRAMDNTPTFLLLMVLVTPGPGAFPGLAMDYQECHANLNISGADGVANITTVPGGAEDIQVKDILVVHPEAGFKGISLVVKVTDGGGDHELHDAWVPMKDKRFKDGAKWWQVQVMAKISNVSTDTYTKLEFIVKIDDCVYSCVKTGAFKSVMSLRVTGHGDSSWGNKSRGSGCATKIRNQNEDIQRLSCQASPLSANTTQGHPSKPAATSVTPTHPFTSTTMPIVVAAVVAGIVVAAAAAAVVAMRVLRRRDEAITEDIEMRPQNTQSSGEEHVTVNSMYESYDRRDSLNSMYESYDRRDSLNSLYEPLENVRPKH